MTTGLSFSTMATHEFVVPRSMPITRSMKIPLVGSPLLQAPRQVGYPIILWRNLARLLELPFGGEAKPCRNIHFDEYDARLNALRQERHRLLREVGAPMHIARAFHERVGRLLHDGRVARHAGRRLHVRSSGFEPLA